MITLKQSIIFAFCLVLVFSVSATYQEKIAKLNARKAEIMEKKSTLGDVDVNTYTNYLEVDVLKYDITIYPDFETKTIAGEVIIEINPYQDIYRVYLDAWHLQVNSIKFQTYQELTGVEKVNVQLTEDQYMDNLDLHHSAGGFIDIDVSSLIVRDGETLDFVPEGQKFKLTVNYVTDQPEVGRESGFIFVDAEYTIGQKQPLLYTQNEPIYARTWFPCFDTPFESSTYVLTIVLQNDFEAYATASVERDTFSGKNGEEFIFENKERVSTFNVGFVVGDYEEKLISDVPMSIKLIAEKGMVDDFSEEVGDIESWIEEIEKLLDVEYPYEGFQLVLMPPNYPHRGAQHGQLTYVSPTIMNSGKQGEQAVLHQIASAYFGNIVSCSTWENMWINDGLATYIERMGLWQRVGISYSKLDALVGNDKLQQTINSINKYNMDPTFSSLHPDLLQKNPDSAYSQVSFEKGFQFMHFIEYKVMKGNIDTAMKFLNKILVDKKGEGLSYVEFDIELKAFLLQQYGDKDGETRYELIDWDKWIFGQGPSPVDVISDLDNDKYEIAMGIARKFLQFGGTSLPTNYKDILASTDQVYIFLDYMITNVYEIDRRLIRTLENCYNFADFDDYQVLGKWYVLTTLTRYNSPELKEEIRSFLGQIGRNEFIVPVYEAWREAYGQDSAGQVLTEYLNFYHPNTIYHIENVVFHTT